MLFAIRSSDRLAGPHHLSGFLRSIEMVKGKSLEDDFVFTMFVEIQSPTGTLRNAPGSDGLDSANPDFPDVMSGTRKLESSVTGDGELVVFVNHSF